MKRLSGHLNSICFSLIALGLAAVPPMMAAGTVESPVVIFLGKCIAFAAAGIGLDLIWGYTGILSLGHGLYFALGGYCMAMHLKLQATHGAVTEFMHTGGLTELPAVWKPFVSLPATLVLMTAFPAALAFLIGHFVFRNRVKGVYFSIISQALTWAAYSVFIALSPYTNGNVGITEISSLAGKLRGPANQGNLTVLFYASLGVLCAVYALSAFLVARKFGKILIAIRDGENRTYFSGYRVSSFKTFIYALSAVIAALAGAVFVNFNGSVTPSQMTVGFSVNMVIWVAIGGRGTIVGAVIGALLVNLCEYNLSSGGMTEYWQYVIGALFCLTILFFKGGVMGLIQTRIQALAKKVPGRKTDAAAQ